MRLIQRATVLFTLLIFSATASLHAQAVQRRILVLYQHDPNAPGVAAFTEPLKAVLREEIPAAVEIYDEYLDLDRFPGPNRLTQLARYFAEKYQGFKPDAIVTEGTRALRFATERLSSLFPGVPIVYGVAFEPGVDFSALPPNVTGQQQPLPFISTYLLARGLQPDAERVVVVSGAGGQDSLLLTVALREITPLLKGMELGVLQDWSYESLLDSLRRMPPRTFVIFSSFMRDQLGRMFYSGDLIASLTRVASVPVYGIARNWVGNGIVGGAVMNFADDGLRTGRLLVEVLRRAPGEPLPLREIAATPLVVDWRELQRWGLSENRLPRNTQLLFRTLSPWERYRTTILATLCVLLLQSALILWLLVEHRRRRRSEAALRESETRAVEQRLELAHLARVALVGELSTALAHEMKQPLAAIMANVSVGRRLLQATDTATAELREILDDIGADDQRASDVIDHLRDLVKKDGTKAQVLSTNQIVSEVLALMRTDLHRRGVVVSTRLCEPAPMVLGDRVQLHQVILNLVMNACDAMSNTPAGERLLVASTTTHGDARIEIRDVGSGIAPDTLAKVFEPFVTTKPEGLGLGLAICRSIITSHGGHISAANNRERGATFVVALPLSGNTSEVVSRLASSQSLWTPPSHS
ncbi:MAG TPA: ATP-binding protein [Gemmatimonadales bacterium]|nr:ATP-binding protein [Gemmatimonadales bacterium]